MNSTISIPFTQDFNLSCDILRSGEDYVFRMEQNEENESQPAFVHNGDHWDFDYGLEISDRCMSFCTDVAMLFISISGNELRVRLQINTDLVETDEDNYGWTFPISIPEGDTPTLYRGTLDNAQG